MRKNSHYCSIQPPRTSQTPFCHHSYHWPIHCGAQNWKCSFPLPFVQYPIMPLKECKSSSLIFLQKTTWPVGGLTSHPKQTLIFLFKTRRQLNSPSWPFENACGYCTTSFNQAQPSNAILLDKFSQPHKETNVYINTLNGNHTRVWSPRGQAFARSEGCA